jgi:hypothetical protein
MVAGWSGWGLNVIVFRAPVIVAALDDSKCRYVVYTVKTVNVSGPYQD